MELLPTGIGLLIVVVAAALLGQALVSRTVVYDWERGLEYANGRMVGTLGPGAYWRLRLSSRITRIDVRPMLAVVPGQEILSSDGVTLKVSLVARYRVADPVLATNQSMDHVSDLYTRLQLALREVIGGRPIEEVLAGRGEIGAEVAALTRDAVANFGLELIEADLKDIMFPGELKKTFAQVIQARQEGLAALERARGETAALRNLANAAKLVGNNPALMQLRMLHHLAGSPGNTVVLGAPGSLMPLPRGEAARPAAAADRGGSRSRRPPPADE